jgi:hypothetical protein
MEEWYSLFLLVISYVLKMSMKSMTGVNFINIFVRNLWLQINKLVHFAKHYMSFNLCVMEGWYILLC